MGGPSRGRQGESGRNEVGNRRGRSRAHRNLDAGGASASGCEHQVIRGDGEGRTSRPSFTITTYDLVLAPACAGATGVQIPMSATAPTTIPHFIPPALPLPASRWSAHRPRYVANLHRRSPTTQR